MKESEEQTTKSPKIAFLPTREMRGSKNSTFLSLVRSPSRDYLLSVQCLIAFFNNKNNSFFGLRYVPLVIKAIAVGLIRCSLAEDGTMFVLSYFCT